MADGALARADIGNGGDVVVVITAHQQGRQRVQGSVEPRVPGEDEPGRRGEVEEQADIRKLFFEVEHGIPSQPGKAAAVAKAEGAAVLFGYHAAELFFERRGQAQARVDWQVRWAKEKAGFLIRHNGLP